MFYLNEKNIKEIGINWSEIIGVIENATKCLGHEDYAQPIKPYLRYRDLKNRIIAMPAFIGGDINKSGIKWIASFPDNIEKGIPRAHSVVILNNADTGEPQAIINTGLLSVLRTAGVTGAIINAYKKVRPLKNLKVGMTGWGPIGQHHFKMINEILGDAISDIYIYDLRAIDRADIDYEGNAAIHIADSWQEAYQDADIFMTCTVSKAPYIDLPPKKGSLHLNVSLRDYKTDIYEYVKDSIIVDDWEEVCREKTDIEMLHKEKGLVKEGTKSIVDALCNDCIRFFDEETPVMFNPMGMAIFDIALGTYFLNKAKGLGVGQELE